MASNEINTVGAIQDKFGGYWVEWSRSQCLTKAEILGSNVFTVNGNYGDTECPRMDDIAKKVNSTVLLLPGDSFYDQSVYGHSMTIGGGFAISAGITHYMPESYVLDNNTQYCYTTGVNPFLYTTSEFTMEAWVYPIASGDYKTIFSCGRGSYLIRINPSNKLQILKDYVSDEATSFISISLNQWSHVALVNYGGYLRAYLNGQLACTSASATSTYVSPYGLYIGQDKVAADDNNNADGERFMGRMEQIRVSNIARYTSNFTPPSGPFSNDG